MRTNFILQVLIFIVISILDIFFHALIPPLQHIKIIPISGMLFFLFKGFEDALIPIFLLGVLSSYLNFEAVGPSSIIFLCAGAGVYALRNTIITHENTASIFILSAAFHAIILFGNSIKKIHPPIILLQEIVFSIAINAFITFLCFIVIKKFQKQLAKRFIQYEN